MIVDMARRMPEVLSPEEVAALLEAAPSAKWKAALSTAYGAGLRVSEVVNLKVSDVDSERMMLRIERGKGRKDRHAMLSPQLLELLRAWWLQCRSPGWLFPGRDPLSSDTIMELAHKVAAGFDKVLSSADEVLDEETKDALKETIHNFRDLSHNIKVITGRLERGEGKLGAWLKPKKTRKKR